MTLRITGGVHRGRRLRFPKDAGLRPTSDRARGAIFSILGHEAALEARVLDLYAGTGALGMEALSRGAASADFVEADPRRCRRISAALESLGLSERCRVYAGKVERRLESLGGGYGLVFADPPYGGFGGGDWRALMGRLMLPGVLSEGAAVVAEHRRGADLADAYAAHGRGLGLRTRRAYGDTAVSIYGCEGGGGEMGGESDGRGTDLTDSEVGGANG